MTSEFRRHLDRQPFPSETAECPDPPVTAADQQLRESIEAYDRSPEIYAERYMGIDFHSLREEFLAGLATSRGPVLDAGAGPGRDSAAFAETEHPTFAVDLSRQFVTRVAATTAAHAVRADLRRLPFAAQTFEGVWMCASLVHLPENEIQRALAEARRVLRRDGVLFCSMAYGDRDEWRPDQAGNRRWFHYLNREDADRLAQQAGLAVVRSSLDEGVAAGRWINLWARPKE